MDDLDVLARDFGFGNRGKANPMKPSSAYQRSVDSSLFSDVFGGQPKYTTTSNSTGTGKQSVASDFDYDSIFKSSSGVEFGNEGSEGKSSLPVFDKPVYDEDIFDGLPGLKSKSNASTIKFDDEVLIPASTVKTQNHDDGFDDLLGNLGRNEKAREENISSSVKFDSSSHSFDDLLAGFGSRSSHANNRPVSEPQWDSMPTFGSKKKNVLEDPFVVTENNSAPHSSSHLATDPLEELDKLSKSRSGKTEVSSGNGGPLDDLDPLSGLGHSSRRGNTEDGVDRSSFGYSEKLDGDALLDGFHEASYFGSPNDSGKLDKNGQTSSFSQDRGASSKADASSASGIGKEQFDDIWLTVSEIPLFTQPSTAPPPSRPPPPIPRKAPMPGFSHSSSRRKGAEFPSPPKYAEHLSPVSQFDEFEDFAMGRTERNFDENAYASETNMYSAAAVSAAAMKDAMDKAEAKFRHAKEVREREYAKAARNKESAPSEKHKLNEEEEIMEKHEQLENERKRKEEEREQQRLEREKLEKEKARQAVERATREARERAAAEARMKAERAAVEKANAEARERAERAAVQRAQAEARERAAAEAKERVAAQRVQAEARERAAAEAKERADKAAAEAREREAAVAREKEEREKIDARRRAERLAVERATQEARKRAAAEARERAAAEAREKAAAAAQMSQEKNDNDLESFFSSGRASSAPKARTSPFDPFFDQQFQSKGAPEGAARPPSSGGTYSSMKKASSSTNIVDDLSAIFGGPGPTSGVFQEVEGETEERRRARFERQQRTQERAAKALAEKNQRDIQAQREQEERHKYAEVLDFEIKRWAAGKEGNLRALLSTLQYVLWPECGWQPVSLTDLITGASVKKVYRKATLCIHPDKVQQKGATLQQKYIAEKVFDLLKEAWNKFNSEELF